MNFEYLFFYSSFPCLLYSIFYTVLVTSLFGTITFAFYWLISPVFRKILFPKAQKQVLSFLLLLFFLPYQVFLMKIPTYVQIVGNYGEWTPELHQKSLEEMMKAANPSYFRPEEYLTNFYQIMTVLAYIWLVVMGILTVKGICSRKKSQKHLKKHLEPICDQDILEVYRQCSKKMGIQNPPELFTHPYISTPMLTGFFEPKIFLPSHFSCEKDLLSTVFLHELSHYKGKDLWVQCFGEVSKIIHWFNPAIYVLQKTRSFWCEVLCDQVVVEDFDKNQRINYAQSILFSAKKEELELLSVAKLSEGTWKPLTMRNRLAMICQEQHHKKSKWKGFLSRTLLVVFCAILLHFCFKIGEKAPIVDSVFPYVKELYPRIVIYYPDFQNF